jgi:hypothetical protein
LTEHRSGHIIGRQEVFTWRRATGRSENLIEKGLVQRVTVSQGYLDVLRLATATRPA